MNIYFNKTESLTFNKCNTVCTCISRYFVVVFLLVTLLDTARFLLIQMGISLFFLVHLLSLVTGVVFCYYFLILKGDSFLLEFYFFLIAGICICLQGNAVWMFVIYFVFAGIMGFFFSLGKKKNMNMSNSNLEGENTFDDWFFGDLSTNITKKRAGVPWLYSLKKHIPRYSMIAVDEMLREKEWECESKNLQKEQAFFAKIRQLEEDNRRLMRAYENAYRYKESYRKTEPKMPQNQDKHYDFFEGCRNVSEIKKRYAKLSGAYHPDNSYGNEKIMKEINLQYNKRMKSFER